MVDDDSAMRVLFEIYLRTFGYRVLLARDGEEAFGLATDHPDISLMIMDAVMSGLSGQPLVDKIKTALPKVRILFCSGHPASALIRQGIDLEAGHFLQKPCRPADLKRELAALLASARAA
jgi:two-component system, cell cycle sensor histidine kinase and response regulator CckA